MHGPPGFEWWLLLVENATRLEVLSCLLILGWIQHTGLSHEVCVLTSSSRWWQGRGPPHRTSGEPPPPGRGVFRPREGSEPVSGKNWKLILNFHLCIQCFIHALYQSILLSHVNFSLLRNKDSLWSWPLTPMTIDFHCSISPVLAPPFMERKDSLWSWMEAYTSHRISHPFLSSHH